MDEEWRCGAGNDRQGPVRLRFNLYQGSSMPVRNGAFYRGHPKRRSAYQQTPRQLRDGLRMRVIAFLLRLLAVSATMAEYDFHPSTISRYRGKTDRSKKGLVGGKRKQ